MTLDALPTPALLLDRAVLERNCARMAERARALGVRLRPHLKTAKSAEVAAVATRGQFGGLTVSTVAEAAWFAARGFRDLVYAVGIAAAKVPALAAVQRAHGACVGLLADSADAVRATADAAGRAGATFELHVEVDTGGGRGGVAPDGPELLEVARAVHASPALRLAGVLTHAGHGYHAHGLDELRRIAEDERAGAVRAAERLRAAGLPCPVVSVGSTPTMAVVERLDGVTEMRPGVYTLLDLDQVARGVCTEADVAVSVLTTVIGHNRRAGHVLVDAGALALSKDTSAEQQRPGIGYGAVRAALPGHRLPADLHVADVHQEHGFVVSGSGEPPWDALPIGARVRIVPNHACLTAAPYGAYHVLGVDGAVEARWEKLASGW